MHQNWIHLLASSIIQNIGIERYLIFHCHVTSKCARIIDYLLYIFDAVHVNLEYFSYFLSIIMLYRIV